MKQLFAVFSFLILLFTLGCVQHPDPGPEWVIVVHGGAGDIRESSIPPEYQEQYHRKLSEALDSGARILDAGGMALDAVQTAVMVMEDSPLFNAGKGAVFNGAGENEMDASIMDGNDLRAGAVACVKTIRNPIYAARLVMDQSNHVMLVCDGAEKFASEHGAEMVDPSYFFNQRRYDAYRKASSHGTVGAVAMDRDGNLAAATSTGGLTNKMPGRVGDSPIIGAGTYANNRTCAISATGHGEYFMRYTVAHDISALMEYRGMSLHEACKEVIQHKLAPINASGGVIAVDKNGHTDMVFNTNGMFRGYMTSGGDKKTFLFSDGP